MLTRLANSRRSDIQIQIEKLRGELGAATAEKESETEKRENIIQQLKDDLATVEQVAEENTKSMLDNMEIENKKIQGPESIHIILSMLHRPYNTNFFKCIITALYAAYSFSHMKCNLSRFSTKPKVI